MPIDENYAMPKGESMEFTLFPEGVYLCEIEDVEIKSQKKFNSEDMEDVFRFTFKVVEGKFKGERMWKKARMIMSAGWDKGNPSVLYSIYCAAVGQKLKDEVAKQVTPKHINAQIGKKIVLVIKEGRTAAGEPKSVIDNYMVASAMPAGATAAPESTSSFEKELEAETAANAAASPAPTSGDEINVDDIPF